MKRNFNGKTLLLLLLTFILALGCTVAQADGKTVTSIEVDTKPEKSEFVVEEAFSYEGGTLLVTYSDGSTEVISMDTEGVSITPPGLSAPGTKQVRIKYEGKSCRYTVKVVSQKLTVSFDLNYEGAAAPEEQGVLKGNTAELPNITRDGYTLCGWYLSKDYIQQMDFKAAVTEDMTVYALWQKNDEVYYTVTFDYAYYGAALSRYSYPVAQGAAVEQPSAAPVRTGYRFVGWLDSTGSAFDFASPINADTVITASWEKTAEGVNDYVFEAEDTDLTGKIGPALSGQAVAEGMIIMLENRNCSGDRYVSYLYQHGLSVDFYFASDMEVQDAVIYVSLSEEYRDYTYNPENYRILLNGEALNYDEIVFTKVPASDDNHVDCLPFQYYLVGSGLTLQKGANTLILETYNNEVNPGTTMLAAAPIVDAVKISTSAVLTWDGTKGLPRSNY